MAQSVSHVMSYSRRPSGSQDSIGGLPTHLAPQWPQCQVCQLGTQMAFVGQLYAKDWLPMDDYLAIQFYVCDRCRKNVPVLSSSGREKKRATFSIPSALHIERLPRTAPVNTKAFGTRCPFQPKRYINYTPVEDSMDQWEFNRRRTSEVELPDKHLRLDKLGGLFPYDEGVRITKQNMMIGQLHWQGFGGTVYLFHSTRVGIYPWLYY